MRSYQRNIAGDGDSETRFFWSLARGGGGSTGMGGAVACRTPTVKLCDEMMRHV